QVECWEVLDLLTALVGKSLVLYEDPEGEHRYRLLETVRQYAQEKLLAAGESDAIHERHLSYLLKLAEEAEPHLASAEQTAWLESLEAEHDDFRAALEWSEKKDKARGLRLAGALWRFWYVRGYVREGRERLGAALQSTAGSAELLRA